MVHVVCRLVRVSIRLDYQEIAHLGLSSPFTDCSTCDPPQCRMPQKNAARCGEVGGVALLVRRW
jgi:hypothetical protein